jgi:hypothetical protein
MYSTYLFVFLGITHASVSLSDPSDVISPAMWADDNAMLPSYRVLFISVQLSPIIATHTFEGNFTAVGHGNLSTALNQTNVILSIDGAELNLSYVTGFKSGYASNQLESSFYESNAAINVVS